MGVLPTELALLTQLQVLSLPGSTLEGSTLSETLPLASIRFLDTGKRIRPEHSVPMFRHNLTRTTTISSSSLTHYVLGLLGSIPSEMGVMTQLQYLDLTQAQVAGVLPSELGRLTNLNWLDFPPFSQLSGTLPSELGTMASLEVFRLLFSDLKGTLPSELGHWSFLRTLLLQGSNLEGRIPTEMGNLSRLQYLSLGDNNLNETIPVELQNCQDLRVLSLWQNQLTRSLPGGVVWAMTNLLAS
jgi:Leucine-rich repeat (LRR) protein